MLENDAGNYNAKEYEVNKMTVDEIKMVVKEHNAEKKVE